MRNCTIYSMYNDVVYYMLIGCLYGILSHHENRWLHESHHRCYQSAFNGVILMSKYIWAGIWFAVASVPMGIFIALFKDNYFTLEKVTYMKDHPLGTLAIFVLGIIFTIFFFLLSRNALSK